MITTKKSKNRQSFIKVCDPEAVKRLTEQGFTLVDEDDGVFTFINDSSTSFNHETMVYSNQLSL